MSLHLNQQCQRADEPLYPSYKVRVPLNDYKRHETKANPVGRPVAVTGHIWVSISPVNAFFQKVFKLAAIRSLGRAWETCDSRADPDPLGGQKFQVNECAAAFYGNATNRVTASAGLLQAVWM